MLDALGDRDVIIDFIVLREDDIEGNSCSDGNSEQQGANGVEKGMQGQDGKRDDEVIVKEDFDVVGKPELCLRRWRGIEGFDICELGPRTAALEDELQTILDGELGGGVERLGVDVELRHGGGEELGDGVLRADGGGAGRGGDGLHATRGGGGVGQVGRRGGGGFTNGTVSGCGGCHVDGAGVLWCRKMGGGGGDGWKDGAVTFGTSEGDACAVREGGGVVGWTNEFKKKVEQAGGQVKWRMALCWLCTVYVSVPQDLTGNTAD